jgi:hypothetical protein
MCNHGVNRLSDLKSGRSHAAHLKQSGGNGTPQNQGQLPLFSGFYAPPGSTPDVSRYPLRFRLSRPKSHGLANRPLHARTTRTSPRLTPTPTPDSQPYLQPTGRCRPHNNCSRSAFAPRRVRPLERHGRLASPRPVARPARSHPRNCRAPTVVGMVSSMPSTLSPVRVRPAVQDPCRIAEPREHTHTAQQS